MKQRATVLILILLAAAVLSGCGASRRTFPPPDLTGHWIQVNPADNFYQVAEISDDWIEVYWHLTADDTEYLYWAGSFTPPQTGEEPYSWISENDMEKTMTDVHARREDTLTFTYKNGRLSFIQIQGRLHLTVAMEKVD